MNKILFYIVTFNNNKYFDCLSEYDGTKSIKNKFKKNYTLLNDLNFC